MTRKMKAILVLFFAAEIVNSAKVGVLKGRIADLETQRDIYASRAQNWLDRAVEDEEVIDSLQIYCSGEILIPLVTEDRHMVGIICQSHLAPLEDEIKNNGFIRYYQRKQTDGTVYYVVKNGMRVRAAVMAYTVPDYAESKLQELVAMLAETHIGEQ